MKLIHQWQVGLHNHDTHVFRDVWYGLCALKIIWEGKGLLMFWYNAIVSAQDIQKQLA